VVSENSLTFYIGDKMAALNFYDVDKNYIAYLKQTEINNRGFTCVPDMEYNGQQKFLCGVVLEVNNFKYYVPVTSYSQKQSENMLIVFEYDKYNKVKGSLRFNYMFPVSDNFVKMRIIKNEQNAGRRLFLNSQLQFCIDNEAQILNQARRTYNIVTKELNKSLLNNACMFKLLEEACLNYNPVTILKSPRNEG